MLETASRCDQLPRLSFRYPKRALIQLLPPPLVLLFSFSFPGSVSLGLLLNTASDSVLSVEMFSDRRSELPLFAEMTEGLGAAMFVDASELSFTQSGCPAPTYNWWLSNG